jgi:hypothetical protein
MTRSAAKREGITRCGQLPDVDEDDERFFCNECGLWIDGELHCPACYQKRCAKLIDKCAKLWAGKKIYNFLYNRYIERFRNRGRDMILMLVYKWKEGFKPAPVLAPAESQAESVTNHPKFIKGMRGYCYAYLFPARRRAKACRMLGPNPTVKAVNDYLQSSPNDLHVRKQRLYFISPSHCNVVVPGVKIDLDLQLEFVAEVNPNATIGGPVDPNFDDSESEDDEREEFVRDVAEGTYSDENYLFHVEEYRDDESDDSETKYSESEFSDEEEEVDNHRRVGGAGLCYTQLPGVITHLKRSRDPGMLVEDGFLEICDTPFADDFTAIEVAEAIDEAGDGVVDFRGVVKKPVVLFEEMEDGNLHIAEVKYIPVEDEPDTATASAWSYEETGKTYPAYGDEAYIDLPTLSEFLKDHAFMEVGSTLDKAINQLKAPDNQNQAEGFTFPWIGMAVKKIEAACPWAIPEHNQKLAEKFGIPFTARAPDVHRHPIHAALRRESYREAIKYIHGDCTVMFMKPDNFDYFQSQVDDDRFRLENAIFDMKDFARFVNPAGGLSHNVFNFPKCDTPYAHWDECGHFKKCKNVADYFADNPNLNTLTVTHITPLERMVSTRPANEDFCQWTCHNGEMVYIAERDFSNPYPQPEIPELLMARTIRDDEANLLLYCAVTWNVGNTFLQVITRYKVDVPKHIVMNLEAVMPMPRLFRSQPDANMIPVRWWVETFAYLKSIKEPVAKDVWAKLRQLESKREISVDVATLNVFVPVVLAAVKKDLCENLQSKFYDGFWEAAQYKTLGHLKRIYNKRFRTKYQNRWSKIITDPNPVGLVPLINVRLEKGERGPESGYNAYWEFDPAEDDTVIDTMKNIFTCWFKRDNHPVNREMSVNDKGQILLGAQRFATFTKVNMRRLGLTPQAIMDLQAQQFIKDLKWSEVPEVECDAEYIVAPKPTKPDKKPSFLEPEVEPDPVPPYIAEVTDDCKASTSAKGKQKECVCRICRRTLGNAPKTNPYRKEMYGYVSSEASSSSSSSASDSDAVADDSESDTSDDGVPPGHIVKRPDRMRSFIEDKPVIVPEVAPKNVTKKLSKEQLVDKDPGVDERVVVVNSDTDADPDELPSNERLWRGFQNSVMKVPVPIKPQVSFGVLFWDELFPTSNSRRWKEVPFRAFKLNANLKYPKEDCLLGALNKALGTSKVLLLSALNATFPADELGTYETSGLGMQSLWVLACKFDVHVIVHTPGAMPVNVGVKDGPQIHVQLHESHWKYMAPKVKTLIFKKDAVHPAKSSIHASLVSELSKLPMINWHEWIPEKGRAIALIRAMVAGTTGLLGAAGESKLALKSFEAFVSEAKDIPRMFCKVDGSPGCRKSSGIQKILRQHKYHTQNAFKVICPTNILAADWRAKLDVQTKKGPLKMTTKSWYVQTFEVAIAQPHSAHVIILDEHKFSKGYLAFLAFKFPNCRYFIFLGDCDQCEKHETNPDCSLNDPSILGEGPFYNRFADFYMLGTWRFSGTLANITRTPSLIPDGSKMAFSKAWVPNAYSLKSFYPHKTIEEVTDIWNKSLTVLPAEGDVLSAQGLNLGDLATFAGSQGLTAPFAQVVITPTAISACDVQSIWTALTRSYDLLIVVPVFGSDDRRKACNNPLLDILLNYYMTNQSSFEKVYFNDEHSVDVHHIIGKYSANTKVVVAGPKHKVSNLNHIAKHYPPDFFDHYIDPDVQNPRGGHAMLSEDDPAYQDAHMFRLHIPHVRVENPQDELLREATVRDVNPRTHTLKGELVDLSERINSQVKERYDRELSWAKVFSEQMPDLPMYRLDNAQLRAKRVAELQKSHGLNKKAANAAVDIELAGLGDDDNWTKFKPTELNWGQYQRSDDHASFAAGVAQRLRKQTYEENLADYHDNRLYGYELFNQYKEYLGWSDPIPFDEIMYEDCKAEFSARRAARSQALKKSSLARSEPDYVDVLTAKNQLKMKEEIPPKAKPLQTILIKSDEYLFKLGGLGVYLLRQLIARAPPNYYLHAKKTVNQFLDWIARYDDSTGEYVSIDITGFDGSQRGASLVLEECYLKFFNVPEDLINFYLNDKLDAHTRSFHLGLMRLSGELFTWLFNTVFQSARTVTKYAIPYGEPMCGSGDDIELFKQYPIRPQWALKWQYVDICEEKQVVDSHGDFCSWIIKRGRAVRNPQLLFMRLRAAISRGKLDDVIDGYFMDFMTIYKQKDWLYEILTPNHMEYSNYLANFFFNLKRETGVNRRLSFNVEIGTSAFDEIEKSVFLMQAYTSLITGVSSALDDTFNAPDTSAQTAQLLIYNQHD